MTEAEIAAFVDGRASATARAIALAHLESCADCRLELVEVQQLLETAPSRDKHVSRAGWLSIATIAAAAAVIFLVVRPDSSNRLVEPLERTSSAPAEVVEVLEPASPSIASSDEIRFTWRGQGRASYRITIANAEGRTLWSATTTDTSVALPDSVRVTDGEIQWFVDALRMDGTTATSGSRRFRILDR